MAISLGFGIVFATMIILVLVPCLYMIQEDAVRKVKTFWSPSTPRLSPEGAS
ncbi:MAG TPA: hypothetical protein VKP65_10330 [Rhodothermales bacterium]|nr:hypothetical protein [Rhodothermales bacterium]